MTVEQAIKFIRKRCPFISSIELISKEGEGLWIMSWEKEAFQDEYNKYTNRALINFAQIHKRSWSSPLTKKVNHGRNRARTRELLASEKYSEIPQNKPCHKEDKWNWD